MIKKVYRGASPANTVDDTTSLNAKQSYYRQQATDSQKFVGLHILFILSGFIVIIILWVTVGFISISNLQKINDDFQQVVQENNVKGYYLHRLQDAIRERMLLVHKAVHINDPFLVEDLWEEFSALAGNFISYRERLLAMNLTPEQTAAIDQQRLVLGEAQRIVDFVFNLVREGEVEEARIQVVRAQDMNTKVVQELETMALLQQTLAKQAVQLADKKHKEARKQILSLIALSLLLSAVVVILIIVFVLKQGNSLKKALSELAETASSLKITVEEQTQELVITREANVRMSAELDITRRLQQMILPREHELSAFTDIDIAAHMAPAEEVGGDYYDVLHYHNRIIIGIGDVTGHGLESSVVMLMVQSAVRALAVAEEHDLTKFLTKLNQTIFDNLQRLDSSKNLTFLLAHLEGEKLTVCGQHEEILIGRAKTGKVERIDTLELGFPLGLEADIASFLHTYQVTVYPEDVIIFYTDGITEAENRASNLYGLERLCQVIEAHLHHDAQHIHQAVVADLKAHINDHRIFDDITLMVLKRKTPSPLTETCA